MIVSIFLPEMVMSQCSMCKAVVETGAHENPDLIEGVNNGILYMMGVPYILLIIVGFAWYNKFGKTDKKY